MKPNTRTVLSTDKLTVKKKKNNPEPMANLTVTGDGIETHTVPKTDPYEGMTPEEKSAYFLESLLYYVQQAAPGTISPQTKGIYYMLAYSPLAVLGFHKFYLGKCLQGIIISGLAALSFVISGGVLLSLNAFVVVVLVLIETYRDWTGRKPLRDAYGRPLR
jgi:TM2 domain-containing membrane protein YozV